MAGVTAAACSRGVAAEARAAAVASWAAADSAAAPAGSAAARWTSLMPAAGEEIWSKVKVAPK